MASVSQKDSLSHPPCGLKGPVALLQVSHQTPGTSSQWARQTDPGSNTGQGAPMCLVNHLCCRSNGQNIRVFNHASAKLETCPDTDRAYQGLKHVACPINLKSTGYSHEYGECDATHCSPKSPLPGYSTWFSFLGRFCSDLTAFFFPQSCFQRRSRSLQAARYCYPKRRKSQKRQGRKKFLFRNLKCRTNSNKIVIPCL